MRIISHKKKKINMSNKQIATILKTILTKLQAGDSNDLIEAYISGIINTFDIIDDDSENYMKKLRDTFLPLDQKPYIQPNKPDQYIPTIPNDRSGISWTVCNNITGQPEPEFAVNDSNVKINN